MAFDSGPDLASGSYPHWHRIVDNNTPIPPGSVFFPSCLQKTRYKTGFFVKWHMGAEADKPKAGFDQWVSFRRQGTHLPNPNGLNVDGKKVPPKELYHRPADRLRPRVAARSS